MRLSLTFCATIFSFVLCGQNVGIGIPNPLGKLHIISNSETTPTLKLQNQTTGISLRRVLEISNNASGTGEKESVYINTIGTSSTDPVVGLKSRVVAGTSLENYAIWSEITGQGVAIRGESTDGVGMAARFDGQSYLNGKVGIMTDNPLTTLHIHDPNSGLNTLSITPMAGTNGGDSTSIFFGEDQFGLRGMLYLYDGASDELQLIGKNYNVIDGVSFTEPHFVMDRTSGNAAFTGDIEFKNPIAATHPSNLNRVELRTDATIASNNSSLVGLYNQNGDPTIRLYSHAGGGKGFLELRDGTNNRTIELDAAQNDGGEIILSGNGKKVEIMAKPSNDKGGRIRLYNDAGNARLVLDSEYGADGKARMIVDEIEIRGGADLTEAFDIIESTTIPQPGMLACVDELNPGKLNLCSEADDKKIIGVISGANGIRPGMMLSQEGSIADGAYPIAVTGRVYVKANTQNGAIQPGDFITTSDVTGEAMKVNDYDLSRGAIIGKALTGLKEGYVLILVSLQ